MPQLQFGVLALLALGLSPLALVYCRRRSRRLARRGRARLIESVAVHARDAIVVLAAEPTPGLGRAVVYVNQAFTGLTGYTSEEMVGRSLHVLRGPDTDLAALAGVRAALERGEPHQTELMNYAKDGRAFWVELSLVPVRDDDDVLSHWVMIQRDVSARKLAEARLSARERELRVLGDNLPGGAVYQLELSPGRGYRFVYVSVGILEVLGFTAEELLADAERLFTRLHPDDWAKLRAAEGRSTESGTAFDCEFRVRHEAGDWRTLHCRAMPEPLSCGGTRWNGVIIDRTEHHRLEGQLRQSQKMEGVGQLAGGVAHDFNNYLTVMTANLSLVDLDPADPSYELVQAAARAAHQASEVARKLLGFARRSQIRTAPTRLNPLVLETLSLVRRSIDPRVVIRTDLRADETVAVDVGLVGQAILNVLLNARDVLPDGGTVHISTDSVVQTARPGFTRGERDRPFVCLAIRDDGPGIPPDIKARLFEPFVTSKPLGQGTGLGLAMVHGIVEQHGGWVECDSCPSSGTEFRLYLPAVPATVSHHTPPPPTGLPTPVFGERLRVLVVDDEEMIRSVSRMVLERANVEVIEAGDGREAVEAYRDDGGIDLVILDVMMPVMDGREAYDALKRLDPDVRILFSSGYCENGLATLPASRGLVLKPWTPGQLLEAVRRAVDVSDLCQTPQTAETI